MKAVKVTSKGQITLPIEIRTALGIDEGVYLEVLEDGEDIRLRKMGDVSADHDRHLADGEMARWRESS
jgi:AbrB family looped-hinge helix DNA binding protein